MAVFLNRIGRRESRVYENHLGIVGTYLNIRSYYCLFQISSVFDLRICLRETKYIIADRTASNSLYMRPVRNPFESSSKDLLGTRCTRRAGL